MNSTAQTAWEIIRSQNRSESIYYRIGKALTSVIASDVSAIEVFDRNGDYAERRWSNADVQISRNFDSFLANRFSHPLFREFVISGLRNPVRISDCIDNRGFHATGMFNEFFRPLGISTQMAVALPCDSIGIPVLTLARSRIDYSPEEKGVLRELIPKIRRQIAAEQTWGHYDLLIRRWTGAEGAVALIAFHEYVVHAAPQVSDLLDRYFPDSSRNRSQLPQPLVLLLRSRSGSVCSRYTFRLDESQSSLMVTVCDSENGDQQILSFREMESPHKKLTKRFDLSPRLVDVLLLIEEGCSNKQIAERLRLSPNTIRTLVEKLLHRMKVPNRTQAASIARKCLDDV
jgi:DNA-binding CsgD family transcriptional regulator